LFGVSHLPELLIVLVLALVVFGPKRLPEIGGAMGRGIREFRKGTSGHDESEQDHEVPPTSAPSQISSRDHEHEVWTPSDKAKVERDVR
jgi:sec-independent protein translocase protein TatA